MTLDDLICAHPTYDRTRRELCGIVASVPFYDAATGAIIARLRTGETVIGQCDEGALDDFGGTPTPLRFMGCWIEHPSRGWQFRFDMFMQDTPADRRGVVAYLCRELHGVGMTDRLAARLWETFGADVLTVLRTNPEQVQRTGLMQPFASAEAARQLAASAAWERTKIDLFTLFASRGFPRSTIRAACEHPLLGVRAAELIRRDPYLMLTRDLPGVGFKRADKLYLELGHDAGRLKRQFFAAWAAMRDDNDGHTWHPDGLAKRAILSAVGLGAASFERAVMLGIRAKWLTTRTDVDGRAWYTEREKARDEATIARELKRLAKCPPRHWPGTILASGDGEPTEHQAAGLRLILGGSVAILGGRPGTGKTWLASWLLGQIRRVIGKDRVAVACPTGKAAVRITEAMERYAVDVHPATTIHRLLEIGRNGHDGKGWGFLRNAENPLDLSVVVIDEASMIDTPLMASLLSALPDGCHVLIVGDPGQLPPVGHGCPLRDMLAAGVPSATLTEIKRNAGMIVQACHAIHGGKRFATALRYDDVGGNLLWVETATPEMQVDALRRVIEGVKASGKFDPVWETQVLTPLNEASPVSRVPLNDMLQAMLNPLAGGQEGCGPFRLGDKIICLRNSFMTLWEGEDSYVQVRSPAGQAVETFIANGDVGRVLSVDEKTVVVRFMFPDRVVKIEMRRPSKGDGDANEGRDGGGIGDFALAYALTIHKSQGSEYLLVIVMADDAAGMVASRELWYTSLSRASKLCVVIGRRATCDKQCRRVSLTGRKTFLVQIIKELNA